MIFSKIAEHSKIRTVHLRDKLAFNAIKTFKAARIKLLKQVGIKKTFMIFWEYIKNISGKQQVLIEFNRA